MIKTGRLYQTQAYTIRELATDGKIQLDEWDAICEGVFAAMLKYCDETRYPHLFVTVVEGSVINTGPDEFGFGLYQQGLLSIVVAAGYPPAELNGNRFDWLCMLKETTIHEVIHYWQDVNGTLTGSKENEEQAEAMAISLMDNHAEAP